MAQRQARTSKLIGFDFRVQFRPGAGNVVADTQSHQDTETMAKLAAISTPFAVLDELRRHMPLTLPSRL
jgi:hypothetical protein